MASKFSGFNETLKSLRIPSYVMNKYVLAVLVFLIWITFFDQNNLMLQVERGLDLRDARAKRAYYNQQIETIGDDLDKITNDTRTMEQYAREKYYMKRDNEEVFVIVEKQED